MLREALKHPAFAQCVAGVACALPVAHWLTNLCGRYLLSSPVFYELLAFTDVQTFEVASDAFLTFKELLTRHAGLASAFLLLHSDAFFKAYNNTLLASTNYVTRRQSLKARSRFACAQDPPFFSFFADVPRSSSCWASCCSPPATWR